jgi:3-oxoacyl-[acyl-carrier protein] reductase
MSDTYTRLVNAPVTRTLASRVGLPRPVTLERRTSDDTRERLLRGRALLGGATGGRLIAPATAALDDARVDYTTTPLADERLKALLFDASAIRDCAALVELHRFFHPVLARLEPCGRIVVLGTPPQQAATSDEATAQRALEGFARSLAKEVGRRGTTVQLVLVDPGAERLLDSTLRFLLSPSSAYVSGQVVHVADNGVELPELDWKRPLDRRVALVTGAARGIGRAIAQTLARDGAHVVGLDVPGLSDELQATVQPLGGEAVPLDITADGAALALVERFGSTGALDVLVHNAGVTRDRTLAKMPEERWQGMMEINLCAPQRLTMALLEHLRPGGSIVYVSSLSAIAGNPGQTNYATSKAGLIGMVHALAPQLRARSLRINAVAPGFIETAMTAAMPLAIREAGRRMNSLAQGGVPQDVAEAIAWLASPGSAGVSGNVVRVCGQSLLGA